MNEKKRETNTFKAVAAEHMASCCMSFVFCLCRILKFLHKMTMSFQFS